VIVTEVSGDKNPDLVIGGCSTQNIYVLLGKGAGQFGAAMAIPATTTSDSPYATAVGDFTGDKILDIATANYLANDVGVFTGAGNGTFNTSPKLSNSATTDLYGMTSGDYNGDGLPDLAINSEGNTHQINVMLNNGGNGLGPGKTYAQPVGGTSIITTDFDGDRKLDIAVFCSSEVAIYMGQ
jgi:hypothetical protein